MDSWEGELSLGKVSKVGSLISLRVAKATRIRSHLDPDPVDFLWSHILKLEAFSMDWKEARTERGPLLLFLIIRFRGW